MLVITEQVDVAGNASRALGARAKGQDLLGCKRADQWLEAIA